MSAGKNGNFGAHPQLNPIARAKGGGRLHIATKQRLCQSPGLASAARISLRLSAARRSGPVPRPPPGYRRRCGQYQGSRSGGQKGLDGNLVGGVEDRRGRATRCKASRAMVKAGKRARPVLQSSGCRRRRGRAAGSARPCAAARTAPGRWACACRGRTSGPARSRPYSDEAVHD